MTPRDSNGVNTLVHIRTKDTGIVLAASSGSQVTFSLVLLWRVPHSWGSNGHSLLPGSGRSQILSTAGDLSSLLPLLAT